MADWGPGSIPRDALIARIEAGNALEFGACEELEEAAAERFRSWPPREGEVDDAEAGADDIISLELARSTKTFRGVVELCRSGYGEQAAMLNRSLFEGMAVAHWVHANTTDATERFNACVLDFLGRPDAAVQTASGANHQATSAPV